MPVSEMTKKLQKTLERERKTHLTKMYGKFADDAAAIPESVRAQMTLLIGARQLRLIECISEETQLSKQEYIRRAVDAQLRRDLTGAELTPAGISKKS